MICSVLNVLVLAHEVHCTACALSKGCPSLRFVFPCWKRRCSVGKVCLTFPFQELTLEALCSADFIVEDVIPGMPTLDTAAPELVHSQLQQTRGRPIADCVVNGPAADMCSAGVVLFAMLTGELPFEYLTVHNHEPDPLVRRLNSKLQGSRSWVCIWLLLQSFAHSRLPLLTCCLPASALR